MIDYITWALNHPIQAFLILFVQYAILATLHNKFPDAKWMLPLFIIFQAQNIFLNWTLFTFLFVDRPEEWDEGITFRLKRYKKIKLDRDWSGIKYLLNYWRYNFAVYFCKLLNKFDENHC